MLIMNDTEITSNQSSFIAGAITILTGAGIFMLASKLQGKSNSDSDESLDPSIFSKRLTSSILWKMRKLASKADDTNIFATNNKVVEIEKFAKDEVPPENLNEYGRTIYRYIMEISGIMVLCIRNNWMIYNYLSSDPSKISPMTLLFELMAWFIYHVTSNGAAVKIVNSQNSSLRLTQGDLEYLDSAIGELKAFSTALKYDFATKNSSAASKVYELIQEQECTFKTVTPLVTLQNSYKGTGYDFIYSKVTTDELPKIKDIPEYLIDDFRIALEKALTEPCSIVKAEREATNAKATLQKFADMTETVISIGKKFFGKP